MPSTAIHSISFQTLNLQAIERATCIKALNEAGSIVDAATLLGITRHALKRRIIKHNIAWPVRVMVGDGPGEGTN